MRGNIVLNVGCVQRGESTRRRLIAFAQLNVPATSERRYRSKAGDVLFTRSLCAQLGASLGSAHRTGRRTDDFHLLRVRPSPERMVLLVSIVYAFQGCGAVTAQINISSVGATRAGFNTRMLEEMWMPLPSAG